MLSRVQQFITGKDGTARSRDGIKNRMATNKILKTLDCLTFPKIYIHVAIIFENFYKMIKKRSSMATILKG